jgi:hypothetical protein
MADITAERFRLEKTSGMGSTRTLPKLYLKCEKLVEEFRADQPPRIAMVADASVWFFGHREFEDDVAMNHEFDESCDARSVAVNEFLV